MPVEEKDGACGLSYFEFETITALACFPDIVHFLTPWRIWEQGRRLRLIKAKAGAAKSGEVDVMVPYDAAIVTKAVHDLAGNLENSVSKEWNGLDRDARRIDDLIKARSVLGSAIGIKRKYYARSPILQYMKSNIHTNGTIYVAGRVMLTCTRTIVAEESHSCLRIRAYLILNPMLRFLDLDPTKPSDGLLRHLIASLSDPDPGILILDDFMTQGINANDVNLLNNIKKGIRESGVAVVFLTANQQSANFLLSQNDLKFVCPLPQHPCSVR
eukprot:scaffold6899_cov183-Amphora_coffeaeformis.AAC.18